MRPATSDDQMIQMHVWIVHYKYAHVHYIWIGGEMIAVHFKLKENWKLLFACCRFDEFVTDDDIWWK